MPSGGSPVQGERRKIFIIPSKRIRAVRENAPPAHGILYKIELGRRFGGRTKKGTVGTSAP